MKRIEYRAFRSNDASVVENLFADTFTRSENESEGKLIGKLVNDLIHQTDPRYLFGYLAVDEEQIIGSIFFSRLTFKQAAEIFMMAPVAVHTNFQGLEIGQNLIHFGLQEMKKKGTKTAITYGDPAFYTKTGFEPLSQELIPPPLELSQPIGWLGQSLTGKPIRKILGPSACVKAFDNPAYW